MKKLHLIKILLIALFCTNLSAQITSYKSDSTGVSFGLADGFLRIDVCGENTIGVKFSDSTALPDKQSLVVIHGYCETAFSVNDAGSAIEIVTSKVKVSVQKSTSLLSFYTSENELILSENYRSVTATVNSGFNTHRIRASFNSPPDEAIFGLGQHQQSIMNYKGRTQWLDQSNMEVALPIIVSNKGYGIMWDNYAATTFDGAIASNTQYQFDSEAGKIVDYYFFYGPEIDSVISAYRKITGTAPMFPKWSFGLFQSMDKYESSADLLKVSNTYRSKKIPFDCIVQDWDYWNPNPWGSHKMNNTKYPDPKALIDSLHRMNVHTMISIWPIHSVGDAYFTEFENIGANYPSNGTRQYYDPHSKEAREIYWRQLNESLFGKYGWDAWWADGCEPDNWPDAFNRKTFVTALGPGVVYNNTYPLMHTSSVAKGWRESTNSKRLFVLSRSAFLGQQRNATAIWSGDIKSNWTDFKKQLSAGLNFSLSGMPYWTTDIGGYWGADWTKPSNRELFTRWFQFGAFCPIFRIHGKLERTLYSEVSWDENTRATLLTYDKLRYRLMPYIYSLSWKITDENYTIMRHLVFDNRTDEKVYNISDQYLFGPSIMVCPVADSGITERTVYFPAGKWYDFWSGKTVEGGKSLNISAPLEKLPLYVKAGSIIPMGPEIEYATQSIDPIEIRIYTGADGKFELYEDEGDSYNYEKGKYSVIPFSYNESTGEFIIGKRMGSYKDMPVERTFKIVWVKEGRGTGIDCPQKNGTVVKYKGVPVTIKK